MAVRPTGLDSSVTCSCPITSIIIGQVAKAGNAAGEDLRDRKTVHNVLRQMAMEISYRFSNCKQKEIGAIFGVDYSTVSQSRARLKAKLESNRKLKKQFHRIQVITDNLSKSKICPRIAYQSKCVLTSRLVVLLLLHRQFLG